MRVRRRLFTAVTLGLLYASAGFGSAIVPGFNTTSDGRNDDGTYTTGGCDNPFPGGTCAGTAVPIGFFTNFYGTTYSSLYINTDGDITFNAPLPTFNPFSLVDGFSQIIAPYFADVDTRNPLSGVVTFGNGTFGGHNAFGVNWINVGYFDQEVDKTNSFQVLLVDRSDVGSGDFDLIFNYDTIQWEAGDGSFGLDGLGGLSSRVGFADGTGVPANTLELAGSGVPGSFIDGGTNALISNDLNSDTLGRYVFNFRDGVNTDLTGVPEPATFGLIAAGSLLFALYRRRISR